MPLWPALAGLIGGAIAGSFIATLVLRWPRGDAVSGRSACDGCGRTLSIRDLVPVLSLLAARGRCRTCGGRIDRLHIHVELAAAVIGALALACSPDARGVAGALFGWQLLTLALLDVRHLWLPDRLTLLLAVTGIAAIATLGLDPVGHIIGGAAGFATLFAIGWTYTRIRGRVGLGGGDPKLFGAIGLWLGWQALPLVLLVASAAGLAVALLLRAMGRDMGLSSRVPFGAFLALAAFALWLLHAQL